MQRDTINDKEIKSQARVRELDRTDPARVSEKKKEKQH